MEVGENKVATQSDELKEMLIQGIRNPRNRESENQPLFGIDETTKQLLRTAFKERGEERSPLVSQDFHSKLEMLVVGSVSYRRRELLGNNFSKSTEWPRIHECNFLTIFLECDLACPIKISSKFLIKMTLFYECSFGNP